MNIGFTGTRHGMLLAQGEAFATALRSLKDKGHAIHVFRHGGCRGADVQAARMVRQVCGDNTWVACHPGPDGDPNQEASGVDDERLAPKTHFARNRDIVACCDVLIACPPCKPLPESGGTAYTVGHARKVGKPVWLIWPDGNVEELE